jgi:hypothetical protein
VSEHSHRSSTSHYDGGRKYYYVQLGNDYIEQIEAKRVSFMVQTEATFEVYNCLGIVLGTEPNPTPLDIDGTTLSTTSEQTQATITSWQTRHALAREALLNSLEPAQLIKVLPFRGSAAEMWTRLQQEYGRPLVLEYIRFNNEYTNLRRTESTSITDHINHFNQLLQELEYNGPSTITPLQPESVNLQFMTSLGSGWDTFIKDKGDWIRRATTAELHAEVRAIDSYIVKPKTSNVPANQTRQEAAKALVTRTQQSTGRGRGRGNGYGYGRGGSRGDLRGRARGRGGRGGYRYGRGYMNDRKAYDPDKYCRQLLVMIYMFVGSMQVNKRSKTTVLIIVVMAMAMAMGECALNLNLFLNRRYCDEVEHSNDNLTVQLKIADSRWGFWETLGLSRLMPLMQFPLAPQLKIATKSRPLNRAKKQFYERRLDGSQNHYCRRWSSRSYHCSQFGQGGYRCNSLGNTPRRGRLSTSNGIRSGWRNRIRKSWSRCRCQGSRNGRVDVPS